MKKLYIGFILIFGFLAFVPQIVLGDIVRTPQEEEIYQQRMKKIAADLECVQEKKAKLPQKYSGPNIKLKGYNHYDLYTGRIKPTLFDLWGPLIRKTYLHEGTKNKYFIDEKAFEKEQPKQDDVIEITQGEFEKDLPVSYHSKYFENGLHKNCREYIGLIKKGNKDVFYFADVTNVPPNSYLKYLPKSRAFKVISPTDENYEDIVKKHKEKLEKKIKEENLR